MASLEEYMAQASSAYKPAQTAIQTQLGSLDSNYNTTADKINRNYEQQQSQLESQRNQAAEASSLAAAGSGGAFGGQGNLARRKYYEQTFVPAQTQLQTNKSNELDQLRQNIENQRTSLNAQLAELESQKNRQALQQYWAEQEAERNRQAQIAAAKASSPFAYMDSGYSNQQGETGLKNWNFGNGYSIQEGANGQAVYLKDGKVISAGAWLGNTAGGANSNGVRWDLWNDIWNNGVKTNAVGSDTIDSIYRQKGNNVHSKYSYLF